MLNLEHEVEAALEFKARHGDALAYHHILYAYHVYRSNYSAAARVMLNLSELSSDPTTKTQASLAAICTLPPLHALNRALASLLIQNYNKPISYTYRI